MFGTAEDWGCFDVGVAEDGGGGGGCFNVWDC